MTTATTMPPTTPTTIAINEGEPHDKAPANGLLLPQVLYLITHNATQLSYPFTNPHLILTLTHSHGIVGRCDARILCSVGRQQTEKCYGQCYHLTTISATTTTDTIITTDRCNGIVVPVI